jgi:hypothetical protein
MKTIKDEIDDTLRELETLRMKLLLLRNRVRDDGPKAVIIDSDAEPVEAPGSPLVC